MAEKSSLPHGSQKAEKEKGLGQDMPCKGTLPVTYLLKVGPIS
jgi:hypothetical protein